MFTRLFQKLPAKESTGYHIPMPIEIERKFLLKDETWRDLVEKSINIIQGYLANTGRSSIRIRLSDEQASLNIKGMTLGVTRSEYDYPIPVEEARSLLKDLCIGPLIEKTRHHLEYRGHSWEIDEFTGENAGLIVAEIELDDPRENFAVPGWLGEEVSDDPRYYNICLVEQPYSAWKK